MTNHDLTITESGAASTTSGTAISEASYSDVPTYRKRWVLTVLFLFFIPAMIAIALTGPIYQNDNGRALEWEDKQRYQAVAAGVVFMMLGIARLLAASAA